MVTKLSNLRSIFVRAIALMSLLVLASTVISTVYTYTRVGTGAYGSTVYAATSSNLNYQARLYNTAGNIVPDGNYNLEFKLYNAASGGTSEWTETRSGANKVRVVNGYLSANLGDVTAFGTGIKWDEDHWLTMNVGGTAVTPSWDGEMSPRIKLTSVPYAFQAKRAETLNQTLGANTGILSFLSLTANRNISLPDNDGTVLLDSTGFSKLGNGFGTTPLLGTTDNNGLTLITNNIERLKIEATGNVGIGTTLPAVEKLQVNGGIKLGNSTNTNAGTLRWTGTDFEGYDGTTWKSLTSVAIGGGGGVAFQQNGNSFGQDAVIGTKDAFAFKLITSDLTRLQIDATGNVGIGTTLPAVEKLQVNGGINLGNSTNTNAGTLRWTGTDFEGYDGTSWKSLTAVGSGSGVAFNQNGNTLGQDAVIGTKDAFAFKFITSDIERGSFSSSGLLSLLNGLSVTGGLNNQSGGITNAGNITGIGTNLTATAGLTVTTGGIGDLTFTPGSGLINLNASTIRRTGAGGLSFDLNNAANTTFSITNTGTGSANLNLLKGDLQIAGTSVLTTGRALQNIAGLTISSNGASITGNSSINGNTSLSGGTFSVSSTGLTVSSAGALSGITTLSASGALTAATTGNTVNGLVVNSGSLSNITGFTQSSGNFAQTGTGTFNTGTGGVNLNSATTIANSSVSNGLTINQTGNGRVLSLSTTATTTSPLINLTHSTSAYTGTGLLLNIASGSGSFASGNFADFQLNGSSKFKIDNTGALTISSDNASGLNIRNSGGISYFGVDTIGGAVRVGDPTADATAVLLVLDTKNTAGDPTGVEGGSYYNSVLKKNRCFEDGLWKDCISETTLRSFLSSTVVSVVDNNTTNYWRTAAENNNSFPNIILSTASGKAIFGTATLETRATSTADTEVTARIERSIGVPAVCGTGTAVGGQPGTFSSNTGGRKTSTTTFMDTPNTTLPVYYTMCADVDTVGVNATINRIRITLQEVNNSN